MKITVEIDYELKGIEHHVWERFAGSKAAIEWLETVGSDVLTGENKEEAEKDKEEMEKEDKEDAEFEGEMEQRELDGLKVKEE